MFKTRIITFMAYPELVGTPKTLLLQGTNTYTLEDKIRVFTVRQVFYDESLTPHYSLPRYGEERFDTMDELLSKNPLLSDMIILDNEHSLKIWDAKEQN
jgi:hypothetical protein